MKQIGYRMSMAKSYELPNGIELLRLDFMMGIS